MSCHGCAATFGFMKKEHGCANCGYAFCASCLSQRAVVHRTKITKRPQPVCDLCYKALSGDAAADGDNDKADQRAPVAMTVQTAPIDSGKADEAGAAQSHRFLGSADPPLLPPSMRAAHGRHTAGPRGSKAPARRGGRPAKSAGATDEDRLLRERLDKLKEEHEQLKPKPPSQSEIEERLAALRGCDVELVRNPRSMFVSTSTAAEDNRPPVKNAKDLLDQIRAEVDLENRVHGGVSSGIAEPAAADGQPDATGDPIDSGQLAKVVSDAQSDALKAVESLKADPDVAAFMKTMEERAARDKGADSELDSDELNDRAAAENVANAILESDAVPSKYWCGVCAGAAVLSCDACAQSLAATDAADCEPAYYCRQCFGAMHKGAALGAQHKWKLV